jgi:hypothetical protein
MNRDDATTAWIVAGVLAVLLIVAVSLWVSARHDLASVLSSGQNQIANERNQIKKDCNGSTATKAACSQDLADLAAILHDFSLHVSAASSTTPSAEAQGTH